MQTGCLCIKVVYWELARKIREEIVYQGSICKRMRISIMVVRWDVDENKFFMLIRVSIGDVRI